MASQDARLRPLAARFRGLKPPRFPTVFETLVNAFACQQLSLEVGLELLNRLAALYEVKVAGRDIRYAFPGPHEIAPMPSSRLRGTRLQPPKGARRRRISRRRLCSTASMWNRSNRESDEKIRQQLLGLRGVGRWTAEYVLLRGLGRLHVFPGDDVGGAKAIGALARTATSARLCGRTARRGSVAAIRRYGLFSLVAGRTYRTRCG
jgi:DNA-3-methyladenine glycosylase II